jgi:phage terminase large subunit-like protein
MVARTAADVRDVMVEGVSGILAISPDDFVPDYKPGKRRLEWPNGTVALLYSGEEPNALRGPAFHWAWADEFCAWRYQETWEMLQFGLRLGENPQTCVSTTPRPTKHLKDLVADPFCITVRGSTYDNRLNLAPGFFRQVIRKYEGTRLGLQELNAEILDDNPGALWTRAILDETRVSIVPPLTRIVVGVDPEASSGEDSAETGIVVAGLGVDGHGYVLDDCTIRGSPIEWGRQAVAAYHRWSADRLVGEVNNGGETIGYVILSIDDTVAYKAVHASRSKQARAEPISALWEQGRCHMVGCFPELEDSLTEWVPGQGMASPDRLDGMVWALWELMLTTEYEATVYDEVPAPITSW